MAFRDELIDLRVEIRADNFSLRPRDREFIEQDLEALRNLLSEFPVAELHIHLHRHPRQGDFHVKTNLRLTKISLFTGERGDSVTEACESCLRKLRKKIKTFKEKRSGKPAFSRSQLEQTQSVRAEREPSLDAIEEAVRSQEFLKFREELGVYEESLTARVGRWIQRYPDLEMRLGEGITISDVVQAVYLNAFEKYGARRAGPLGKWLEGLIDPSIQLLRAHPALEKEHLEHVAGWRRLTAGET